MYKEIELNPYIPEQIKIEEDYYNEIITIYAILLNLLSDSIQQGFNKYQLMKLFNSWLDQNKNKLEYINGKYANKMTSLVLDYALDGKIQLNKIEAKAMSNIVGQDLDINQQFLNNSIAGRFIAAIPTGTILVTSFIRDFIPEDESIEELITRGNNSIKKFVRFNVSQGTSNLLAAISDNDGYNEYLAGNEKDDRVRELHKEQNDFKTWHRFDNPPSTGLPGTEPNCRCNIISIRGVK